ncbi:hypothetical protein F5148DRAFT_694922 [Russula earlei]|uniref:Uncharacterized protein n=1 Tax=Russula earlei TaxID=71964 RepID=A0ACC0UG51_9AGAM|nr:hypothetical protein F5148DRAFT_694922 [Russula earlei]
MPSNSTAKGGNPQSIPPSLVSTAQVGVAQASQGVPPSQVQAPVQIPDSVPNVSLPSDKEKLKPPPKRQSSALDFLQLDLRAAREKKMRASALAAGEQKLAGAAVTTSPVSTPTADVPDTPAALIQTSTSHTAAQAAPDRTPQNFHRDLRKMNSRNVSIVSPRRLQITGRVRVPISEPGSSSSPIVIDEDEEHTSIPVNGLIEADASSPTPNPEATPTASDPQEVQGSKGDARDDRKPQVDQDGRVILPQEHSSVSKVESRPLVSNHELSAANTPKAEEAVQNTPVSSTSDPLSSSATVLLTTPASRTRASAASIPIDPARAQLQYAAHGKVHGKVPEIVESSKPLSIDTASGATIGPSLGVQSSAHSIDPTPAAIGVMAAPKDKDIEMMPLETAKTAPIEAFTDFSPALVVSLDDVGPASNIVRPDGTEQRVTAVSVAEEASRAEKHQRPPSPSDSDTRRVSQRKSAERQQDPSVSQSVIVRSPGLAPFGLGAGLREQFGRAGTATPPTPSMSNLNVSVSKLPVPATEDRPSTESRK